ncbi:LADA_0E11364g1_1 [Lachancea dasiensis]|uniref:tRNA wybutosine-synthesizing protein 2 n=1 Tax=Lachancea dasiensis TaxID=1072105 RepID=A0A1G4JEI8_9SACH|nr:LADA_0E11364g1_1 [Lachancea dasiensis]
MGQIELLVSNNGLIKGIKTQLEQIDAFERPIRRENNLTVIKTKLDISDATIREILSHYGPDVKTREYQNSVDVHLKVDRLSQFVVQYLGEHCPVNEEELQHLLEHLPLRFSLYQPLVLFNFSQERSFLHSSWKRQLEKPGCGGFMKAMLAEMFPNFSHVATNRPIVEHDTMRRPFHIVPLEGELLSGAVSPETWELPSQADFDRALWCHVVQNGIHQVWAPAFTMFSRGNIKEKKRILDPTSYPEVEGNDVVDLYAGIGYFALSYLKRRARRIFCFELNPWSTEGLRRGVNLNKFSGECNIFQQSNEDCLLQLERFEFLQIRHINLGLLPTSRQGYPWALHLVLKYGATPTTTLHIHENVHIGDIESGNFAQQVLKTLSDLEGRLSFTLAHVEKVKTFAPDVWHCVLDLEVSKRPEFH